MARTRTLTNLIADVRACSDTENDTHVTDAQITEFLNQAIAELYDLLVDARGHEYYITTGTISLVAGTEKYNLPSDFYQMLHVEIAIGNWNYDVLPYSIHERTKYNQLVAATTYPGLYRVMGSQISFLPVPRAAFTVTIYYVPFPTRLSAGSDTFDGIAGWEEYAVWRAAAYVLAKEESDPSFALQMLANLKDRIQRMADKRSSAGNERVRDTLVYTYPWFRLPRP